MNIDERRPTAFETAGSDQQYSLLREIALMLMENKKWWLIPIFGFLLIVSILIVLGSTGAAPFIYTLF